MIKINPLMLLKQYNLKNNEMSNIIKEKTDNLTIESLSLEKLLGSINIKLNNRNQLIAKELIKLNLPLSQDYFKDINQFLNNSATSDSENNLTNTIKIAILLKKLDLPLTSKIFNLFAENFETKENLAENILDFLESSKQLSTEKVLQIKNNIIEDNLELLSEKLIIKQSEKKDFLDKLDVLLNKQQILPERKSIEQLAQIINDYVVETNNSVSELKNEVLKSLFLLVFTKINLSSEDLSKQLNLTESNKHKLQDIFSLLFSSKNSEINKKEPYNFMLPKLEQIINSNPQFFSDLTEKLSTDKELITEILNPENITPEKIKTTINSFNLNNKQTKLVEFIFNLNKLSTDNENAKNKTGDILKHLITNKIINLENDLFTLLIPFFDKTKQLNTAQIQLNEKNKKNSKQNSYDFSFIIDSNQLGNIEIKVKFNNNNLSILFITEKESTNQLIKSNLKKLETELKDSFKVKFIASKLLDKTNNEETEEIIFSSIDLKA